ncbi:MAG: hypothetical protein JNM76_11520 [Betaproteobacteria bacterium]|nr:hypothetical protein [Betaproteobacteria bacterium]
MKRNTFLLAASIPFLLMAGCATASRDPLRADGTWCVYSARSKLCTRDPIPTQAEAAQASAAMPVSNMQDIWIVRNEERDRWGRVKVDVGGTVFEMLPGTAVRLVRPVGETSVRVLDRSGPSDLPVVISTSGKHFIQTSSRWGVLEDTFGLERVSELAGAALVQKSTLVANRDLRSAR